MKYTFELTKNTAGCLEQPFPPPPAGSIYYWESPGFSPLTTCTDFGIGGYTIDGDFFQRWFSGGDMIFRGDGKLIGDGQTGKPEFGTWSGGEGGDITVSLKNPNFPFFRIGAFAYVGPFSGDTTIVDEYPPITYTPSTNGTCISGPPTSSSIIPTYNPCATPGACAKFELNDSNGGLDIYVRLDQTKPKPWKDGTYQFTLVSTSDIGIPPIVIEIPIIGGVVSAVASTRIAYPNDFNVTGFVGDRGEVIISGNPDTGEFDATNVRVDPVIYANQVNGFKISAGDVSGALKEKLLENYGSLFFQCSPTNAPLQPEADPNNKAIIQLGALTSALPADAAVTILDPVIEGSICNNTTVPCDSSAFGKYITVIFTPPAGTAYGGYIDNRPVIENNRPGIIGGEEVDPNSDAPNDGSGGITFPGNGGIGTVPPITTTIGPILVVEPNPIAFDNTNVGTVRTKTFRLRNIGDTAATVTGMSSTLLAEPFFFGFGANYPFQLLPNQAVSGTVTFAPPSAALFEDFAQVTMDLGGADVVAAEVLVTGTGVASGNPGETKFKGIAVSGDTQTSKELNFGNQGINDGPTTRLVTVYNTGNDPAGLTISAATVIGADAVQFSTGIPGGSYTIPYGGIFQVEVVYDPNAAANHTTTFRITSDADQGTDDPINKYNFIDVFGTGTIFTPTRILEINGDGNFGELIAGETEEKAITLSNKGNSPILIRGFLSPGPFTLDLEGLGLGAINPTVFEQSVINGVVYPTVYSYVFPIAYPLLPEITSPGINIIFSPPSVDIYSGLIAIDLTQPLTFGPTTFPVSGVGTFRPLPPPEPEPDPEPDPEPGPDPGVDPPPNPLSPTCIQKNCEIPYIYDYSVNDPNLT